MKVSKGILCYLLGAWLQIGIVCIVIMLLRKAQIVYSSGLTLLFLLVGGSSSALWGIIISKRIQKVKHVYEIIKDFFAIKQPIKYYGMILLFMSILFGKQICLGQLMPGVSWYDFLFLFGLAIVFGGIEEIGWRYTFQPMLEQYIPFELACIVTFIGWGVWHYMYFYLVGTITTISHMSFLVSLLGSCFIIGALYQVSNSLWLAVMYHCLLNVFSQTLVAPSLTQTLVTTGIGCLLAILIVRRPKQLRIKQNNKTDV